MKRFILMLFSVLLAFLSFKKMDNPGPISSQNNTQTVVAPRETFTVVNAPQTSAVNVDTIPPSNAVDVKKYHAKGNGISDDSGALQNAIKAENTIALSAGTYIITKTLIMRTGVKIYGAK